ncbi:MAG: protein phosphatase 2C domain-containing protein [Coriobacteriales bacterium]|jgi:serine/threonine protein phosphatase PrpC|nr:protein phosphatase 2C domain-containing protein [Coriobacteriales bacterium]
MRLSYATFTNAGSRLNNEDSLGFDVQSGAQGDVPGGAQNRAPDGVQVGTQSGTITNAQTAFFAVADGLGGHNGGEMASSIAIAEALAAFREMPEDLSTCFERGQQSILRTQAQDSAASDMKTTLTLLRISGARVQWGHIGDTRLYWFVSGHLRCHTLDHSVPQMLAALGEIREQDIRHHEDRNRLLKVMGIEWPEPRYELADEVALSGEDSFLLATDGFWEYVDEKEMERARRFAVSPEHWLKRMLRMAEKNARGHDRDNHTAIAVFMRGDQR